jgi:arylsulfatase A-like enzyme
MIAEQVIDTLAPRRNIAPMNPAQDPLFLRSGAPAKPRSTKACNTRFRAFISQPMFRLFIFFVAFAIPCGASLAAARPNVVLIMTDDQGYGDIAAHGHPVLKTPHIDRLREQSVRLENFHVDPTCSPTRAALLTGRYSARGGVWHTVMGRNLLRDDETTVAQVFAAGGYRTGIFGKWHLGDNYPYGAKWRGFEDAIVHFGGGVGQTPDYWGNGYFDDHYFDNGEWAPFQGYCTDVWFGEALRFIRRHRDEPFFLYLPLNAPHQTRSRVPARYEALYKDADAPDSLKRFWGMISNIDANLGVLLDRLERWGLAENTIVIFMSDNGTTMPAQAWPADQRPADWAGQYNAGMRGAKGSHYEGGHRVFCFIRHPAGGIGGGREVRQLTAHIDLMPTLLEMCGIKPPANLVLDGKSLVPLLKGRTNQWPDRTLIVHNQRVLAPIKWKETSVMTERWRFINNSELYNMNADPGQLRNVAAEHPEVAQQLRAEYERWWADVSSRFSETIPLYIGAEQQNPVQLTGHDWLVNDIRQVPWNQPTVEANLRGNGPWAVRAVRGGKYRFILRQRPHVAAHPISATHARLRIGEEIDETRPVQPDATGVVFEASLAAGDYSLQTWFVDGDPPYPGAYFVEVEYITPGTASQTNSPARR